MRSHSVIAVGLFLLIACHIPVRAEDADSVASSTFSDVHPVKKFFEDGAYLIASPLRLTKEDLPVVLGLAGAFGGAVALDRTTERNLSPFSNTKAATDLKNYGNIAQYGGPIVGSIFLVDGIVSDNPESKKTAYLSYESFLWASAVELSVKYLTGRQRPTSSSDPFVFKPGASNGGFPSGHTTTAFAAATVFAEQYPVWEVEVPAYAAAAAVGFSRLYANQHWGSDVLAGGLLGYGVSHLLRKLYNRPDSDWSVTADDHGIVLAKKFGGSPG